MIVNKSEYGLLLSPPLLLQPCHGEICVCDRNSEECVAKLVQQKWVSRRDISIGSTIPNDLSQVVEVGGKASIKLLLIGRWSHLTCG